MKTPTPRAVQDARRIIANPETLQDLPQDKQIRLRELCWLIMRTAEGSPAPQRRRIVVKPLTGAIAQ